MNAPNNQMFIEMLQGTNESLRQKNDEMRRWQRGIIDDLLEMYSDNYINCNKCTDDWNEHHCEPRDPYWAFHDLKNDLADLIEKYTTHTMERERDDE